MLELFIISSLLGTGLMLEIFGDEESQDDTSDDPIEITLDDDVSVFDGTQAKEHVRANALDNTLNGSGNNDLLGGLDGADTLRGADGNDRLFGGAGADEAAGGMGNDRIFLGDGDDLSVPGTAGDEDVGDDFIRGGAGNDTITDGSGSDEIFGDLGRDYITTLDDLQPDGHSAPDTVHGGFGNDTLFGDAGDVLTGGAGEDTFMVAVPSTAPDAHPVIADFDLRDDLLSVVFLEDLPADPTIQFEFDAENDQLRALVEGREVATLEGLNTSDIPFLRTFVTTLPDLMEAEG